MKELVGELDILPDGGHLYVNRLTGELYSFTDELAELDDVDDVDDDEGVTPEWQLGEVDKIKEVLGSSDWLEVPSRHSGEEYELMERFSRERCDGRVREELLTAIQGRGAFRRFKDVADRHDQTNEWFAFRDAAIAEDVAEWLKLQGIAFRP